MNRSARTIAALLCCLGLGCAHAGDARLDACLVVPVAVEDLPADLDLRARIRFTTGDREVRVEVVARRSGDELVLLGFAPFGVRLFALRQQGRNLRLEPSVPDPGPLPLWTADALHRAYWIPVRGSQAAWDREGERVVERSEGGVRRREFTRLAGAPPGRVTIEYPHPSSGPRAADGGAGARIWNPWCGYDAVLARLDGSSADLAPEDEEGVKR